MTTTSTTTATTDHGGRYTTDHEPENSTNVRPERAAVTLDLTAAEAHHLARVCELGLIVLSDSPASAVAARILTELSAYQTAPPEAPDVAGTGGAGRHRDRARVASSTSATASGHVRVSPIAITNTTGGETL